MSRGRFGFGFFFFFWFIILFVTLSFATMGDSDSLLLRASTGDNGGRGFPTESEDVYAVNEGNLQLFQENLRHFKSISEKHTKTLDAIDKGLTPRIKELNANLNLFYLDVVSAMTTTRRRYKTLMKYFDPEDEDATDPAEIVDSILSLLKYARQDQTTFRSLKERAGNLQVESKGVIEIIDNRNKECRVGLVELFVSALVGIATVAVVIVATPLELPVAGVLTLGGTVGVATISAVMSVHHLLGKVKDQKIFSEIADTLSFLQNNLAAMGAELAKMEGEVTHVISEGLEGETDNPSERVMAYIEGKMSQRRRKILISTFYENCREIYERAGTVLELCEQKIKGK